MKDMNPERFPHRGLFSRLTGEDEERIAAAAERMDVTHLLLRRTTELSSRKAQHVLHYEIGRASCRERV